MHEGHPGRKQENAHEREPQPTVRDDPFRSQSSQPIEPLGRVALRGAGVQRPARGVERDLGRSALRGARDAARREDVARNVGRTALRNADAERPEHRA